MNIAVMGAGDADSRLCGLAYETGKEIAKAEAILVCGGLGGIMEAVSRGASELGGISIGVLPNSDNSMANPFLTVKLPTGLGVARNILVVSAADAIIAIGGRYGTLSEIAFALNLGKPVVGIETWELISPLGQGNHIINASSPIEAVGLAIKAINDRKL